MDELHRSLLDLQVMDDQIQQAEAVLAGFGPRLASVEAPVTELEREVESLRRQVDGLEQDTRRLERAAEEKRERLRRYQEHMDKVRNAREEAAARTEIDLVRKAIDADEFEATEKLDALKRSQLRLDDFEQRLERAREEVEPRRQEILAEKETAESELAVLKDRRENHATRVPANHRNVYDRIRRGKTRSALAALTDTGACGHCFNTLPVQEQNEVRRGGSLHRCEACGVILYAPE